MCVLRSFILRQQKKLLDCVTSFRQGGYTPLALLKRLSPMDLPSANGFDKPFAASKFED